MITASHDMCVCTAHFDGCSRIVVDNTRQNTHKTRTTPHTNHQMTHPETISTYRTCCFSCQMYTLPFSCVVFCLFYRTKTSNISLLSTFPNVSFDFDHILPSRMCQTNSKYWYLPFEHNKACVSDTKQSWGQSFENFVVGVSNRRISRRKRR